MPRFRLPAAVALWLVLVHTALAAGWMNAELDDPLAIDGENPFNFTVLYCPGDWVYPDSIKSRDNTRNDDAFLRTKKMSSDGLVNYPWLINEEEGLDAQSRALLQLNRRILNKISESGSNSESGSASSTRSSHSAPAVVEHNSYSAPPFSWYHASLQRKSEPLMTRLVLRNSVHRITFCFNRAWRKKGPSRTRRQSHAERVGIELVFPGKHASWPLTQIDVSAQDWNAPAMDAETYVKQRNHPERLFTMHKWPGTGSIAVPAWRPIKQRVRQHPLAEGVGAQDLMCIDTKIAFPEWRKEMLKEGHHYRGRALMRLNFPQAGTHVYASEIIFQVKLDL